jgi:hypothetical protein
MIGPGDLLPLQDALLLLEAAAALHRRLQHRRGAVLADGDPRAGGVQHADGLVRQLAAGDVAVGEAHRVAYRLVEDAHLVVALQVAHHPAQHDDGVLLGGLVDLHHLEAAGEGRVLLEVGLVFGPGGGGDGAQFPAGQGRLEQVGGIALPGLAAGADEGVGLVDEQDDGLGGALHLVDHRLQPLFELPLEAGAGLQQAEVQGLQGHPLQRRRHVLLDDAQGQALHHRGLAHPGVAGEDGVVLPPAGEDVDQLADLPLPRLDGVDAVAPSLLGEVHGVLVQGRGLGAGGRKGPLPFRRGPRRRRRIPGLRRGAHQLDQVAAQALPRDQAQGGQALQDGAADGVVIDHRQGDAAGTDHRTPQPYRGDQPGLAQQGQDVGRHGRGAGVAALEPLHRHAQLRPHVRKRYLVIAQDGDELAVRHLHQTAQQVLDLHVEIGMFHTEVRRLLETTAAGGIELGDQGLEFDTHGRGRVLGSVGRRVLSAVR